MIAKMKTGMMILALAFAAPGLAAENHQVVMKSISYDPKMIHIKPGDSVEWVNKSYTDHSATANDGKAFDTGYISPQKNSKRISFPSPGTYAYHCSMHGISMSGQIVVDNTTAPPAK